MDNPTQEEMWELGRAAHIAKIQECWMKSMWEERLSKEPWDKPNYVSPNQPWHDVALACVKAVIRAWQEQLAKSATSTESPRKE